MSPPPVPFAVREVPENDKAIIFVHGFSGNAHSTFGMMPAFLAGYPELYDWNMYCFGYSSGLCPDITGVWSSDPNIEDLAGALTQNLRDRWNKPRKLALIAHSMGGLVVQRALLDGEFEDRVHSCLLFGTPSLGLRKAGLGRLFKQQAADMSADGPFISDLRDRWSARFANPAFELAVVAGQNDQFVPPASSLGAFDKKHHCFVFGNHLEMVKPLQRDADSVLLVLNRLSDKKVEPPRKTAPKSEAKQVSQAALELELQGREADAIALLEAKVGLGTDVKGTLAGRYKRRWLRDLDHGGADGVRAEALYAEGYTQAAAANDHAQAAYLGINDAFMKLALRADEAVAAQQAQRALDHAKLSAGDPWALATQAEALLHLRRPAEALSLYRQAYPLLGSRERSSMFQQASWTARLLGETLVDVQLEAIIAEAG